MILFVEFEEYSIIILSIVQQVPFEDCHTYYREAKEDHKAIWKSMFKTRNSYQEKPEMAIEKRKKTSYNGTKETNKKRW